MTSDPLVLFSLENDVMADDTPAVPPKRTRTRLRESAAFPSAAPTLARPTARTPALEHASLSGPSVRDDDRCRCDQGQCGIAAPESFGESPARAIRLLLTPTEAAQALGIGRSKLYELMRAGVIASVLIGAARRIPCDELEAYVRTLRDSADDTVVDGRCGGRDDDTEA